ncbi:MAG: SCP-like extracellular protein [Bacillaceae bacterium]|nr:SCP-like extracellular protein [Bacillaceae bacterium]
MKKTIFLAMGLFLLVLTGCNMEDGAMDGNRNGMNGDDNLSSMSTDMSSEDYPHTEAVPLEHAKYDFRRADEDQNQGDTRFRQPDIFTPEKRQEASPGENPGQNRDGITGQNLARGNGENNRTNQNQQQTQTPNQTQNAPQGISEIEAKVIELTNYQRRERGLPDLKADPSLSKVAREKSMDMQANHYFSHTSPTYGSPFDMMRDFGITYRSAGENIAHGQRTAEQVVNAWMNSEGHRENILNPNFTHIGVGYNENGHYWTQMFIQK